MTNEPSGLAGLTDAAARRDREEADRKRRAAEAYKAQQQETAARPKK